MPSMRPQRRRRKIRWKKLILLVIILFSFISSLSWAAMYAYRELTSTTVLNAKVENNKPAQPVSKYINILLLGIDDGDNENPGAPQRSDTMIVASINPEEGTIHLISIPRDTKVAIPGHKGSEKITHAFFYGGTELAIRTVEDLLELHIHHSIVIDWQAFIKAIDVLGGVDLYVENNMHYEDPYANLVINLTKGYQHLNGKQAGQYVRFRSDELGDIGRVQRQQRFLKELTDQTFQVSNLLKLPMLIKEIDQYIITDITGIKMIKLANSLKKFKSGDMSTEMLPGNFATIDGLSYWVHNKEQTRLMVERMLISDNTKMSGIFIR